MRRDGLGPTLQACPKPRTLLPNPCAHLFQHRPPVRRLFHVPHGALTELCNPPQRCTKLGSPQKKNKPFIQRYDATSSPLSDENSSKLTV